MQIPYLNETQTTKTMIDAFGGYDHRARIPENSFYDMTNMTGDAYPALSPRAGRGKRETPAEAGPVQAMLGGNALAYIAGNRLFVDDVPVMDLSDEGPKQMVGMGAYIVIFPDKAYYNTANPEDSGLLEAGTETSPEKTVTFKVADARGNEFGTDISEGSEPPKTPAHMALWLDTAGDQPILKQYNATTGVWTSVLSTTVLIRAEGIGSGFHEGDGVRISGLPDETAPFHTFNGKDLIVTAAGEDWIAFEGIMDDDEVQYIPDIAYDETNDMYNLCIKIARRLPVLDHVIECGNRLWGCRYGEDADGSFVNEIYASALGDFKNWRKYQGISADSYTVSVGAGGPWTGAVAYQGMPHFFKDDVLYRVYGAVPAAFRVEQTACRGVQLGAERSLQILNERLYYKSRTGVCVYDGAYPGTISEAFGEIKYVGLPEDGHLAAAAGAWNNKYYISMLSEEDGGYHLFKFDAVLAAWFREDGTEAVQFAVEDGEVLFLTPDGEIRSVRNGDETVEWSAQSGTIFSLQRSSTGSAVWMRYLSRLTLQLQMDFGSKLTVEIQYDSKDPWIHVATIHSESLRSFSLPIMPRRCDHFRLRISGKGKVQLFSIVKTLEEGSETQ